jgi:hypothetical protein
VFLLWKSWHLFEPTMIFHYFRFKDSYKKSTTRLIDMEGEKYFGYAFSTLILGYAV